MASHTLPNFLGGTKAAGLRYARFALCALALASCNRSTPRHYLNVDGFAQGTTFSIAYSDSLGRDFSPSFDSIFRLIDRSMSVYNDSSTVSRLNRNELQQVDSLLAEVVAISDSIYRETGGAFDITVGAVAKAIGFGKDKTTGIDSARVRLMLPLIGMDKIRLEGLTLIKANPQIQLDVNAVAQGYTADVLAKFLEEKGVAHYMVEVGGEIFANGLNPKGTAWVIGLDKPIEGAVPGENIQAKIPLTNRRGLATSGNYRKFIEVGGQKYSHTINPKTGLPVLSSLLSATVIASSAARADALATAFMVNGVQWSQRYLATNPTVDAYLIYSDEAGSYCVWLTPNLERSMRE